MESLLPTIVSVVLGFVSSFLLHIVITKFNSDKNKLKQDCEDQKLRREADMHLLRRALREDHEYYTKRGWCSVQDKDEVEHTYQTYHGLGGNGLGTALRNDIMALPDFPPVSSK